MARLVEQPSAFSLRRARARLYKPRTKKRPKPNTGLGLSSICGTFRRAYLGLFPENLAELACGIEYLRSFTILIQELTELHQTALYHTPHLQLLFVLRDHSGRHTAVQCKTHHLHIGLLAQ